MNSEGFVAIDALLESARRGLDRVAAADLEAEMAAGALVVDTRPVEQRGRDGELPGAVVIDRNVLEWRLDPTCPHHIPLVTSPSLFRAILRLFPAFFERCPRATRLRQNTHNRYLPAVDRPRPS